MRAVYQTREASATFDIRSAARGCNGAGGRIEYAPPGPAEAGAAKFVPNHAMKTPRHAFARFAAALAAAALALPSSAAVTEDDWLRVETPDQVAPDAGFQVKVTLKRDLGPDENVSVAMHRFKVDGWKDTGQWRPPQTLGKGETKVWSFAAKREEGVDHYGPLVFTAPGGDWNKHTHVLHCGKIVWAMSKDEEAKRKAAEAAAAERSRPPEGITYKKSWLRPRGCFKPGTDEPATEVREGESFDIVVDYHLDPSEYWNDKCHVVVFGCGPWIDNPDGVHEKDRHHVNYDGTGWAFQAVKPGDGTLRFKETVKRLFRYNSLFFHVRFRGGDDRDFPWTTTCGAPAIVRPVRGLDLVAPTAGGLFVAGRERPVLDLVAGAGAPAGAPVSVTVCALDSDGRLEEVGTASAAMPAPGAIAKVDLSGVVRGRLGCFLAEGRCGDAKVDAFFGVIPDVGKALGSQRAPFGATDLRTDAECEAAAKLGFSVNRMFVGWAGLVPRRGEYDFDGLEKSFARQERHGIKPWLLLTGAPEWVLPPHVHSPGFEPYPFDEEGWRESIRAIARKFGRRVYGIEWLNEIVPGNKSSDPVADYKRFCEIGAEELRKVNPEAKSILAGGLWPRNFRLDVLGAGIGKSIDVLPIHYGEYESAAEAIADAAAGGVASVWNDESAAGISVWGMEGREALERSALMSRYVMRAWPAQLAAGVDGIIYFGGEANAAGNWKYLLDDHTPRPVAATLAVLSAKLGDARPVGGYYAEPGARVFVFARRDLVSAVAVVCSANGDPAAAPVEVALPAKPGGTVVRTDHQGNETEIRVGRDGLLRISAGAMPAFYEGLPLGPLAIRCALSVDGQNTLVPKPSVAFVKGVDPQLRVSVRNPESIEAAGRIALTIDGRRVAREYFDIAPGKTGHFLLGFPADVLPEAGADVSLDLAWQLAGASVDCSRTFSISVVDPATLGNLLANGGFEDGKNGWHGNGSVVELPGGRPGEEGHALSLDHSASYVQCLQKVPVPAPGRELLYTAWMRTDDMYAGSNLSLYRKDGSALNLYIPHVFQAPKDTAGAWNLMVKAFGTEPNDATVQVQPVAIGKDGTALYDHVRLIVRDGSDWGAEAKKTAAPKTVDGDLSDWDFADPIPLLCANQIVSEGGYKWTPENLSGVAQLAWDSDALYLAVRVRDDVHAAQTGDRTLSGDALQIGLHPANRLPGTEGAAIEWHVSSASPGGGSGKHTVFRPAAHSAGLSSGHLAKDSSVYEIAVKRAGKDTCYELRIPWSDAGGVRPQPGTRLGLSLRLVDADDGAARGAASWGRGLDPWSPGAFGSLVLLP